MDVRERLAFGAFTVVILSLLAAAAAIIVSPGVNEYYNRYGMRIAPNIVTLIVFDFRGYDTLGECIILVAGVLAVSILYGRGLVAGDVHEEEYAGFDGTPVLRMFGGVILILTMALGVYVALGGHITPGGGFQGGSIIGAGVLVTLLVFGRKSINVSHSALVKMESFGALLYMFLGLAGLAFGGYFLFNLGSDFHDGRDGSSVVGSVVPLFSYPDGLNAGIVPYLNLSVLLKVSAGLTTIVLILLGAKR